MNKNLKKILPVFFTAVFLVSPIFADEAQKKIYPKKEIAKGLEIILDFENSGRKDLPPEKKSAEKKSPEKKKILPCPKADQKNDFDLKKENSKRRKDFRKEILRLKENPLPPEADVKKEKLPENPQENLPETKDKGFPREPHNPYPHNPYEKNY